MVALALALLSSFGPDDADLPRSLSTDESRFAAAMPPPKEEFTLWIGGHLGVAGGRRLEDLVLLLHAAVLGLLREEGLGLGGEGEAQDVLRLSFRP